MLPSLCRQTTGPRPFVLAGGLKKTCDTFIFRGVLQQITWQTGVTSEHGCNQAIPSE